MLLKGGLSKEDRVRRRLRAECKKYPGGLYFFAKWVAGSRRMVPRFHYASANFVQASMAHGFGREVLRKILLQPRETFKSTVATQNHILHHLACVDRNASLGIMSAVEKNHRDWIKWIRDQIDSNARFRWLFPEVRKGGIWGDDEIQVTSDQHAEGSIQSSVVGMSIKGGHASKHLPGIVFDDIVNEDTAQSPTKMEEVIRRLKHAFEILRGPYGWMLYVGTPWTAEDAIAFVRGLGTWSEWRLNATGRFFISEVLAERKEMIPRVKEDEPIFPEELGWEKLRELKQKDPFIYACQFDLNPFMSGNNGILMDMIRHPYDIRPGKFVCECHEDHDHRTIYGSLVLTLDPAYSKQRPDRCHSGIVVAIKFHCGCRFKVYEWRKQVQPDALIASLGKLCKTWIRSLRGAWIEDEALQVVLSKWIKEKRWKREFPQVPIKSLKSRKRSKDMRFRRTFEPINTGLWHFPEPSGDLWNQIEKYPLTTDIDLRDAFAYLEDAWDESPPIEPPEYDEWAAIYGAQFSRKVQQADSMVKEWW